MCVTGSLGDGQLSAVGSGQQAVETVVGAGVVSFVVDVAVVDVDADAAAGKRSLIHKHGAVAGVVSGLTWCRVLGGSEQMSRSVS